MKFRSKSLKKIKKIKEIEEIEEKKQENNEEAAKISPLENGDLKNEDEIENGVLTKKEIIKQNDLDDLTSLIRELKQSRSGADLDQTSKIGKLKKV